MILNTLNCDSFLERNLCKISYNATLGNNIE